ncbi:DUF4012 domain-containing protein [Microbacterium sp.]|uniref:DUF4012 domain-containing protein n=1 Tax=Microbacterium sp. TaxID=51671 RepID=UPI00391B37F0
MTVGEKPQALRVAGKVTFWVVAAFLAICVLAAGWVGVRGVMAGTHLASVQSDATAVASTLSSDPSQAVSSLTGVSTHTEAARDLTSDPVWALAEKAPWIGPQLEAVRTIAVSADDLLRLGVLPLAQASQGSSIDALKPVNGRIDARALSSLQGPAQQAAAKADSALSAIRSLNRVPLLGRLASATDQVEDVFSRATGGLDALSRAAQLLPGMLGESGQRSFLVLVQNNAEFRSLGGIAGTALLLQTDSGAVSLVGTETGTALSAGISDPVVTLPDDVQSVYGTRPARYFQNLTQIPDFSIDGPLARDMYRQQTGRDVDGVIAIDPVVLSYLLKATGAVSLPDGTSINGDNATSLFLKDVYQRYPDPAVQDAFFAASSASIFNAFLEGRGSSVGLLSALARGADERRILLWSANPDEQGVIDGSAMAGRLPMTDDDTARFGVYFNDGGGSKMSYYVKPDVSVAWDGCAVAGGTSPRRLTLSVGLTNTAPTDAASSLPVYVTANGWFGAAPGTAVVVGNIYVPEDYRVVSATASNGASFTSASLKGREVLTYGLNLLPQSQESLSVVVETTSSARTAQAFVTPTADSTINPIVSTTCESAKNAGLE